PKSAAAVVSKQIANLIAPKGKGRRVEVQNADWRAMVAFRDFHQLHEAKPKFAAWQQSTHPLSSVPAVHAILRFDKLYELPAHRSSADSEMVSPPRPAPGVPPAAAVLPAPVHPQLSDTLLIGMARGAAAQPITVCAKELTSHAAFLGGSGSGK